MAGRKGHRYSFGGCGEHQRTGRAGRRDPGNGISHLVFWPPAGEAGRVGKQLYRPYWGRAKRIGAGPGTRSV